MNTIKHILAYIFLLLFWSCSWFAEEIPLTINDQIVIDAANKRLLEYQNRKLDNCREKVLASAVAHVDSIIVSIISENNSDTLFFPKRPPRPEYPKKLQLDSSLQIKPILDSFPTSPPQKSKTDTIASDTSSIHNLDFSPERIDTAGKNGYPVKNR